MTRGSGRSGKQPKARRRQSATLKRRTASKATRNRGASIAGQGKVVARLTHERDEALLRETANSEILRKIARQSGNSISINPRKCHAHLQRKVQHRAPS
jgi:hypothetical protein